MIVMSRLAGGSVIVAGVDETFVATVLSVSAEQQKISILINRASADKPGQLQTRTVEIKASCCFKINDTSDLTLVDLRLQKARLGINAPRQSAVHRLEVYEAIHGEIAKGRDEGDPDRGPAGAPVPKPPPWKPPTLDSRLDEPRPPDDPAN